MKKGYPDTIRKAEDALIAAEQALRTLSRELPMTQGATDLKVLLTFASSEVERTRQAFSREALKPKKP